MHHVTGQDLDQIQMMSLGEMVESNAMVRVIDAFVHMLDLESFEFTCFNLNLEGRSPFHPATTLKIYLYGYQNGIRSWRRLEKFVRTWHLRVVKAVKSQFRVYFGKLTVTNVFVGHGDANIISPHMNHGRLRRNVIE